MTYFYRKLLLFLSFSLMVGIGKVSAESLSLVEPVRDPLLPAQWDEQPLNGAQTAQLTEAISSLETAGFEAWAQGNKDQAFAWWWSQLRLRQVLPDRQAEVESLGRIGAIAWEDNQTEPVKIITERLAAIEQEDFPRDYNLLLPLATAYGQIRDLQRAITLYQQHLQTLEEPYKPEILRLITQLALDWFNTEAALTALEEIKALNALTTSDREQLAALYEATQQPNKAIALQRQLTATYFQEQNLPQLIHTYQQISDNYGQLRDYPQAVSFSRNAFTLAWELGYFDAADSALTQLAQLYLAQDKQTLGTQVYEQLITVQEASYNHFGMMETYRTLGTLYAQAGRYGDALVSLQKGLAIAQTLNHNINEFTQAIATLPLQ